ncbi:MAG: serine/threonine-protein kinase [Polyangiales bacterium]
MVAPPSTHHSSVPPPALMPPGTRLGRYVIVGELGTGGMATVYEGKALSVGGFSRRVAIKYLHPHLLRDEQFIQMFLDEGRLAAQIHHPNVVPVLDLVSEPDRMYMVSEFVEGDQLLGLAKAARDAGGHVPAPVALRVMLDTLAGLHAAHELTGDDGTALRIVHRDVSPHNILVGSDGITRIVDFGIAKAEERISTTRDGIVKGKLSYMAPEQPDDLPVDRRADIFSAATVLWECLTGQRLFPGRTDREVLQALLHKPIPRLRDVMPELPAALDEALARGLARDPDQRFMLASEFAQALETAAGDGGVASARDVAAFVERHASRKLAAERERRRRLTTKELPAYRDPAFSSQVRPVATASAPPAVRTEPGVGPAPASPDEAPTMLSAPHAIQRILGDAPLDEPEPLTRIKTPAPRPAVAAAAPPPPAPAPRRAPPPPSRARFLLPVAVIAVGVALGYGAWTPLQPPPHAPLAHAPAQSSERALVAAPEAVVAPPPVAPPPESVTPAPPSPPPPLAAPPALAPRPVANRAPAAPRAPVANRPPAPERARPAAPEAPAAPPRPAATGFELPRGI